LLSRYIILCDSRAMLSSVRPSETGVVQSKTVKVKLGLRNFHRTVAPSL